MNCEKRKPGKAEKVQRRILIAVCSFLLVSGCGMAKGAEETLTLFLGKDQEQYYAAGIEEFRQRYPEVELTIESYSMNELVFAQQKGKTELMAGKGPDLLILDAFGMDDVYKLLKSGAFAPLDEFMTAENGWQEEEYVSTVIDGGRFEGTQYVMPLTYSAALVLSSEEALGEIGFRKERCQDMNALLKEIASLYEKDHKDRILLGLAGFVSFAQYLDGEFLDYGAEQIGIDPTKLQEACEAYKSLYKEDQTDSLGENGYYGYGLDVVERAGYLTAQTGTDTILMAAAAIASAETPVLLPLGTMEDGATARISQYAGIRANSENKQNAWNLLMLLLGEEMQSAASEMSNSVPVQKSALEKMLEQKLRCAVEEAEASGIPARRPEEAFLEEYRHYLVSPGRAIFLNSMCSDTFHRRMQPFYEDTDTYEACIQEFESYIKIYLSE